MKHQNSQASESTLSKGCTYYLITIRQSHRKRQLGTLLNTYKERNQIIQKSKRNCCTRFGDMPRATAEPPIVYSNTNAQPISHATLRGRVNFIFKKHIQTSKKSEYKNQNLTIVTRKLGKQKSQVMGHRENAFFIKSKFQLF